MTSAQQPAEAVPIAASDTLDIIFIECRCGRRWWVRSPEVQFRKPYELRLRCSACGSKEITVGYAGSILGEGSNQELWAAVEMWNDSDTRIDQVLAKVSNLGLGVAAYEWAVVERPKRLIIFRHGARVIRRSDRKQDR